MSISKIMNNISKPDWRHNKMSPTFQDKDKSICSNKNADDFRHEDLISKVKYMSPYNISPAVEKLSHPDQFIKVVGGFSPPEQLEYDPDNISPGVLVASAVMHDPEVIKASLSQPLSENSPNHNKRYYSPEVVDKAYEEYFAKLPVTFGGEDGDA